MTSSVKDLERWHRVHLDTLLATGDPVAACDVADASFEPPPVLPPCGECEHLLEEREHLLARVHDLEERIVALDKMLPPRGSVTVAVPTRHIEVQYMGNPSPFPIASHFEEVVLGPEELMEAARNKLAAQHAKRAEDEILKAFAVPSFRLMEEGDA